MGIRQDIAFISSTGDTARYIHLSARKQSAGSCLTEHSVTRAPCMMSECLSPVRMSAVRDGVDPECHVS